MRMCQSLRTTTSNNFEYEKGIAYFVHVKFPM